MIAVDIQAGGWCSQRKCVLQIEMKIFNWVGKIKLAIYLVTHTCGGYSLVCGINMDFGF